MALFDGSPKTVDCRLGELCGCGARYCSVKCLVADAQEHKVVCENIQKVLQFFAMSRFRATKISNQVAVQVKSIGHVQMDLLRADMVVAASDIVDALVDVAHILHNAEAFELAQKFAQRALSLAAKDSLDEATALEIIGAVEDDSSKYDAAAAHLEAALNIRKNLQGDKHVDVGRVYANLSLVFQNLGRLEEALTMCSSALEIFSKAPGDNQKSLAGCHNSMGSILDEQGKHEEAIEHYSIGLAISLEGETALAADLLLNIGAVLLRQNKVDEAMEKFVSALRIYEKAKIDTAIANCHHNIGDVLKQQGKFDAALEHARKALTMKRSKLPHEHVDCGQSHNLIGDILFHSGKFAEALDEFDNGLRIRKSVYGEMTLKVADVYESKAMCFLGLQEWREAVTFYEATIHIRTVLLGADDAELVNLKADLAKAEEQLKAERSSTAASERK
jgi:tetratricopeptide (TPR) repeat protein